MNIKIEQKKEYIKPHMTVIECEHEGVLCASCNGEPEEGKLYIDLDDDE